MKESKHTPGPWLAQSRSLSDGSLVVNTGAPDFNEICCLRDKKDRHYGQQDNTDQANALLIAAAPDLIAALEGLLESYAAYVGVDEVTNADIVLPVQEARAAVKKARGQS